MTDNPRNVSDWNNLAFDFFAGKITELGILLTRLARTTAAVEAGFTDREGITTTQKLVNLAIIKHYEISEIDSRNYHRIHIKLSQWIERGYKEEILDLEIPPPLPEPASLSEEHVVVRV